MKTHYAGCDRANESDNMDHWGSLTACGLEVYEHDDLDLTDRKEYTSCKNCLKVLKYAGGDPNKNYVLLRQMK